MTRHEGDPLLTETQFVQLCQILLLFHYFIAALHSTSIILLFYATLINHHSSDSIVFLLLALTLTLIKIYLKFRFFSRDAYIGAGVAGEVGLSLPANTNYMFWGLWCAFELMMALIALAICIETVWGLG